MLTRVFISRQGLYWSALNIFIINVFELFIFYKNMNIHVSYISEKPKNKKTRCVVFISKLFKRIDKLRPPSIFVRKSEKIIMTNAFPHLKPDMPILNFFIISRTKVC